MQAVGSLDFHSGIGIGYVAGSVIPGKGGNKVKDDIKKVVFVGIADSDFPDLGIVKGQKVLAEYEAEYGIEEEVVGFGQYRKVIKKRVVKEVRNKKLDSVPYENWAAGQINNEWRIFYIQPFAPLTKTAAFAAN